VRGRTAHLGVEPEKEANTVHALAHQILQTSQLNDLAYCLSVQANINNRCTAFNVIADHAEAVLDVRALDRDKLDEVDAALKSLRDKPWISDTSLEVTGVVRSPMPKTGTNTHL